MIYLISAIVLLGVLIAIHEFGHFIVGRMCNIHIYRFSIGMGPVIYKKLDKHGTEFALSALPLGGYVAFHTEKAVVEELDLSQPLTPDQNQKTFESKPRWQRALVMLAGPVANFILAIGILSMIFANSVERQFIPEISSVTSEYLQNNSALEVGDTLIAINEKKVSSLQDIRLELLALSGTNGRINFTFLSGQQSFEYDVSVPVNNYLSDPNEQNAPENFMGFELSMKLQPTVGAIASDSNAAKSELKVNDRILEANSQPIKSFEDLRIVLQSYQGSDINFKVKRDEQTIYLNVPLSTRKNAEGNEEKYIGIIPGLKRSFFASLFKGTYETYNLSIKTLTFVGKMITRDLGTQNLSGPIGIVQMAGDTAKAGFMPFLYLMALLSISLGVLNLLPIPVLDGGQLVMLGIEAVRGSPMPEKMENFFYMSGWVAVGFLMIFAVFNDISKFL
ncbi:MAG: RIP metalloprotease RseP [SAR86 cluster bacterium]|mgnify:FL=1|jgi:regulator of sigma E protease|uniref:Zinc metalloprotease n=1 Tax=SAR86 cluster bacterium TaxID=2030880 RepID=A0A838Y486_9GAMM|nr:RIP metalloprotease RseP [SAR86 cluster bacterium]|tara:strand:- start:1445 stop:2788 length:1344 start_codon:yes stop_codon:yes gene_type:complete